jgi:hypothetical protein
LEVGIDTNPSDFADDFFNMYGSLVLIDYEGTISGPQVRSDPRKEDEYKTVLRELFARASRIVVHGVECGHDRSRGVNIWVKSLNDLPQPFTFDKHSYGEYEIEIDGIPLDIEMLVDVSPEYYTKLSSLLADDRFPTIAEKLAEYVGWVKALWTGE